MEKSSTGGLVEGNKSEKVGMFYMELNVKKQVRWEGRELLNDRNAVSLLIM